MLTILTTTNHQQIVEKAIASVDRLDELVTIVTDYKDIQEPTKLVVVNDAVSKPLDWHDTEPPYILPNTEVTEDNLLAVVFSSLGNHQQAFEYLSEDSPLQNEMLVATHIQFGYEINEAPYQNITSKHNQCVVHHYGNYENRFSLEDLQNAYENAIETSENDELKIFTAKHYINLLMDVQEFAKAENLIRSLQPNAISD